MKDTKTTNILLLIITIPIVFYVLKLLSFIFIPLIASMFIALLFLPLMRWFNRRKVPKYLSIFVVLLIFGGLFKIGGELIKLSSREILNADGEFLANAEIKLTYLFITINEFFGIEQIEGESINIFSLFQGNSFGNTIDFIRKTLTMTLMTAFFVVLWLAESINFERLLNTTILKQKFSSVKTFIKIENELLKFTKVKIVVSLLTGLGIGLCFF